MPLSSEEKEKLAKEEEMLAKQEQKRIAEQKLAPSQRKDYRREAPDARKAPDEIEGMREKAAVEQTEKFKESAGKIKKEAVRFANIKSIEAAITSSESRKFIEKLNPQRTQTFKESALKIKNTEGRLTTEAKVTAIKNREFIEKVAPYFNIRLIKSRITRIKSALEDYREHLSSKEVTALNVKKMGIIQDLVGKVTDLERILNNRNPDAAMVILHVEKLSNVFQNTEALHLLAQRNKMTTPDESIISQISSAWQSFKSSFSTKGEDLARTLREEISVLKSDGAQSEDSSALKSDETPKL